MSTVYLIAVGLLIVCSYHEAASNESDEAIVIYGTKIGVLRFTSQDGRLPPDISSCPERTDCMPVTSCDVALQDIRREIYPSICGWAIAGVPLVCCPRDIEEEIPVQPEEESPLSPQGCGKRQIPVLDGSVAAGEYSNLGSWPWMAGIYTLNSGFENYLCGASIIGQYYIVTAAHNIDKTVPFFSYSVRVGSIYVNEGTRHFVDNIRTHPDFTYGRAYNDIAVIRLREPIQFGTYVQPICLPTSPEMRRKELSGRNVAVAGWGILQPQTDNFIDREPSILQEVAIQVIDPQTCNRTFSEPKPLRMTDFPQGITDQFLCGGVPEGGTNTCSSDSGGPMMLFEDDTWILVGVITNSQWCTLISGHPAIYTRVTSYIDWLQNVTAA